MPYDKRRYMYDPAVPVRIKAVLPDAKFLIMLRDPVERAYSHYNIH